MSTPVEDTTLQQVSISVDDTKSVDDRAETLEKQAQSAAVETQQVSIELTTPL